MTGPGDDYPVVPDCDLRVTYATGPGRRGAVVEVLALKLARRANLETHPPQLAAAREDGMRIEKREAFKSRVPLFVEFRKLLKRHLTLVVLFSLW